MQPAVAACPAGAAASVRPICPITSEIRRSAVNGQPRVSQTTQYRVAIVVVFFSSAIKVRQLRLEPVKGWWRNGSGGHIDADSRIVPG